MTYPLNFTEQDWERIELDWTAWWAGELDRPIVVVENPVHARLPEELSREFLRFRLLHHRYNKTARSPTVYSLNNL